MKKLFYTIFLLTLLITTVFAVAAHAEAVPVTVIADEGWSNATWDAATQQLKNVDEGYSFKVSLTSAAWMSNFEVITAQKVVIPSAIIYNNATYKVLGYIQSSMLGANNASTKEVIVSEGITSLSDRGYNSAFLNAKALETVRLPSTLTNLSSSVFKGCSALKSITIPANVTTLGTELFSGCTSLTSVEILGNVTTLSASMFASCTSLTSYTIPSTVTSIGNSAFIGCLGLTSMTIPANVTTIGTSMFANCKALESVQILSALTSIPDSTFSECNKLISVNIPSTVTSLGVNSFYKTLILPSIELPEGLLTIGDTAFLWSNGLTTVTIPSTVTTIGNSAFKSSALTSLVFKGNTAPTITAANVVNSNNANYKIYYPMNGTGYTSDAFKLKLTTKAVYSPYGITISSIGQSNSDYTVTYQASDISGTASPIILIALYSQNNSLVGVKTVSAANTSTTITATDVAVNAKIFALDSLLKIKPLYESYAKAIIQ